MPIQIIDMKNYLRRDHFNYFRSLQYPYVGTTVEVDISSVLSYCKEHNRSFYLAFLHACALAADGVKELRQLFRGDQIVEYDECPTSHVELGTDGTYHYYTVHHHMGVEKYFQQAEEARRACRGNGIQEDDDVESMYFISSLPWLHYTAIIQPVAGGDESNPRITWGKYENGLMPVSILVHHALVDGIHIAQFYENLNREIERFEQAVE